MLFINAVYSLPYFEKLRNEERMRTIGMSDLHIQYRRTIQEHLLQDLEKLLATEISFLYYLNLNFDDYRPINFSESTPNLMKDWFKITLEHSKSLRADELVSPYAAFKWFPREMLNRILDADAEINKLYSSFIAAGVRYQKEVLSSMVEAFDRFVQ